MIEMYDIWWSWTSFSIIKVEILKFLSERFCLLEMKGGKTFLFTSKNISASYPPTWNILHTHPYVTREAKGEREGGGSNQKGSNQEVIKQL